MDLTQQWPVPATLGSVVTRTRVEYRLDGAQLELDAVDCADVPFERGDPVRSFPGWRLKRHYDGYHWMGVLGASIGFESLTERACLIELDRMLSVVAVASQPMWIRWVTPHGLREHYPDYFVRLDDGTAVLIDVKPTARIKEDVREQFNLTAAFASERGWRYVVYDGESPTREANLRFLSPFQNAGNTEVPPCLPDHGLPLADVAALLDVGSEGYARCYALLWSGALEADLDEPLSSRMTVWARSS
ncbi:TnsA-like heteromeric transposase endonuclease subunit [Microbacterium azadirachtae]|uniref:TnsA-like heteromeric transposase endonuclease subunit n=1 Tax=Microbacterium azadirachtae TaxID=582680 RepID=UPI000884A24F|nr:TnsA-like heteromeric transposase endonuclease subunit [Microbacterium azadirachtae]SDL91713.1 TnsA endonuclease N terminal [Microbacterium azadirachtae]SEG16130.1 TnsA endonuclease N terminal [Microbacterium azadirachtae]SEG18684.1 TnsA endonuclease N terminal [Microbacterium azadirachtae]